MQKQRFPRLESATGVDPGLAAVSVLLVFVCLCAYQVREAADRARDALQSGEAMVFFRTDKGILSDDKKAEEDLAISSNGLVIARKSSNVLFIGSALVAGALILRLSLRRDKAQGKQA